VKSSSFYILLSVITARSIAIVALYWGFAPWMHEQLKDQLVAEWQKVTALVYKLLAIYVYTTSSAKVYTCSSRLDTLFPNGCLDSVEWELWWNGPCMEL
jgi:hypothetical protein